MNEKRKKVLTSILIVMMIALGGIVFYYWYNNTHFVITDDATVSGDLVKIGPQIAGKLIEFNVKEGSRVVKDQIVGHLEMVNNADSNIDLSLIRAPFDGVVIKKQCMVGEVEAAGQALAMLVDPHSLYINANIEETKLGRVRTGQKVDITIDQFEGVKYTGKVDFVGLASNFDLLNNTLSYYRYLYKGSTTYSSKNTARSE